MVVGLDQTEEKKNKSVCVNIYLKLHHPSMFQIYAHSFLPNSKRFWHYTGSLTTPPCTNGVEWFLLQNPVKISWDQAAQFTHYLQSTADPLYVGDVKREVLYAFIDVDRVVVAVVWW